MYACIHAEGNPLLLVECARHFSPRIEETSPDTVLFDARGLGSLIGAPEDIAQAIANRAGIPVNISLRRSRCRRHGRARYSRHHGHPAGQ